eukprot:CFRG0765T1
MITLQQALPQRNPNHLWQLNMLLYYVFIISRREGSTSRGPDTIEQENRVSHLRKKTLQLYSKLKCLRLLFEAACCLLLLAAAALKNKTPT